VELSVVEEMEQHFHQEQQLLEELIQVVVEEVDQELLELMVVQESLS
jgi:hypothetical protein